MPHYYFHVLQGTRKMPDAEGVRLPDVASALECAQSVARDLIDELSLKDSGLCRWRVEIRDESGRLVLALPFSQAAIQDGSGSDDTGSRDQPSHPWAGYGRY